MVSRSPEPATSIDVYSPPLSQMTYYDPATLRPVEAVRLEEEPPAPGPPGPGPRRSCCTPPAVPEPHDESVPSGVDRLLEAERATIAPRALPTDLA